MCELWNYPVWNYPLCLSILLICVFFNIIRYIYFRQCSLYSAFTSNHTPIITTYSTHRSCAMRVSSGTNQFGWHSQWASRNTMTSPVAYRAPLVRVPIKPRRSEFRYSFTFPLNCFKYSSSSDFKFSVNQDKSTYFMMLSVHSTQIAAF